MKKNKRWGQKNALKLQKKNPKLVAFVKNLDV